MPEMKKLNQLDTEVFRRKLAKCYPAEKEVACKEEYRELASEFCCVLAMQFNREKLDAKATLWDRIATAIEAAVSRVDNDDFDRLISVAFEVVLADHSKVASEPRTQAFILGFANQDEDWKTGFVRYLRMHTYTAIVFGRLKWESHKDANSKGVSK